MLRPAFAHLESKLPKLLKRLKQPSSVTAAFDRLGWKTGRRSDGALEVTRKLGSAPVLTASDARLLRALAGFIAPDSYVHGTNNVWQLVFEDGRCERRAKK
jgi:hypothetical protein